MTWTLLVARLLTVPIVSLLLLWVWSDNRSECGNELSEPDNSWLRPIHQKLTWAFERTEGGSMGRHRTRPSTLVATTQSQEPKKTQPRPVPISLQDLTIIQRQHRCRKCQGWVMFHLKTAPELRCVNCGWRPQYYDRITTESEESQLIRQATKNLLQEELGKKGLRGGNGPGELA